MRSDITENIDFLNVGRSEIFSNLLELSLIFHGESDGAIFFVHRANLCKFFCKLFCTALCTKMPLLKVVLY